MSFLPIPDVMEPDIYHLTPRLFLERGVRLLLLDIDNTLSPYTVDTATEPLKNWVRQMRDAGLELFLLSNNKGSRPEVFAAALELPFVKRAKKPFPKTARKVMAQLGFTPRETALIGDQIYTDALCAKCCGALAVTVKPIEFSNFWLRLRYWAELPFRRKRGYISTRQKQEETK